MILIGVYSLLPLTHSAVTSPQLYHSFTLTAGPSREQTCSHALNKEKHLLFVVVTFASTIEAISIERVLQLLELPGDGVRLSLHLFSVLKMLSETLEGL